MAMEKGIMDAPILQQGQGWPGVNKETTCFLCGVEGNYHQSGDEMSHGIIDTWVSPLSDERRVQPHSKIL